MTTPRTALKTRRSAKAQRAAEAEARRQAIAALVNAHLSRHAAA